MALAGSWPNLAAVLGAAAAVLWSYRRTWTGRPVNTRSQPSRAAEPALVPLRSGNRRGERRSSRLAGCR